MTAKERWIVVSNCQTHGLSHSLQLLADGLEVEPLDVGQYQQQLPHYNALFGEYDRVLFGPSAKHLPGADFSRAGRADEIPELVFTAYHPDMTYITDGRANLAGPLDTYHSMIAFTAYSRGRSVAEALSLFNARTYAACGFLDRWEAERDGLVAYCRSVDFDISAAILRWGRRSAFMYSTNHPRIHVLYDLARLYLEREGYAPRVTDVLPHDTLANGGAFAVYPEIGEALGVPGSYLFKKAYHYSQIGLAEFVEQCFALYDTHPPGALSAHPVFDATYQRVAAALDEEGAA